MAGSDQFNQIRSKEKERNYLNKIELSSSIGKSAFFKNIYRTTVNQSSFLSTLYFYFGVSYLLSIKHNRYSIVI